MLSEIYETTILKVYLKLFRWNIDMKHEQGGKEEMKIFSVLIAYLNIQVILFHPFFLFHFELCFLM